MRRASGIWPRVASFPALCRAARRAARGQRRAHAVARFLERLEPECLALERELQDGSWLPGCTHTFVIHDPKRRTITAVPFRDRVVHHALIAPLEPVFERRMLDASFACRKGKGTHAALAEARRLVRRFDRFLKLDVAAFFDSVRHDVVRATLERVVGDRRVLALCDVILRGPEPRSPQAVGLPIGSLTSQWFANLVLDRLDHFVKEELRVPGYLRYMDDFALFADDQARLRDARRAVEGFLGERLHLRLKERATVLAPVSEGLPFLGWRVFRGTTRLRAANLRRYRWRLRYRRWQWAQGRIDEATYRQAVASVVAHVAHGSTLAVRRRWFDGRGPEP